MGRPLVCFGVLNRQGFVDGEGRDPRPPQPSSLCGAAPPSSMGAPPSGRVGDRLLVVCLVLGGFEGFTPACPVRPFASGSSLGAGLALSPVLSPICNTCKAKPGARGVHS